MNELREKLFQSEEPYALVVDLELVNFQELHKICAWHRKTAVICTHRLADEEMWVAALAAGAADCCAPGDIAGIRPPAEFGCTRRGEEEERRLGWHCSGGTLPAGC